MKPNGKGGKPGEAMPPQQYGAGWNGGPQWGGPQWGNGPPHPHWQGGPPPPMHQQHYQSGWPASQTPPRRPRGSPEMMNRGMMGGYCPPTGMDAPPPDDLYSRGPGMHDDDGASATGSKAADKDKGRGSYKCGRVSWTNCVSLYFLLEDPC